MALLGFNAVGRFALGQIRQNQDANPAIAQAAGTGVARAVTPTVGGIIAQAAGIGVARAFGAPILTVTLAPAVGIGTAGVLVGTDLQSLLGVSGIGTAGFLTPFVSITLNGVAGIGVAHALIPAVSTGALGSAVGTGICGQITPGPSGNFSGVAGIGKVGIITIQISGGGGGKRRKRQRTGFDQIKKRYETLAPEIAAKLPPPPSQFVRKSPPLVPDAPLPPEVDPALLPPGLALEHAIHQAEDMSAIHHLLRGMDHDDRDAEDIADVLALLDMEEMA